MAAQEAEAAKAAQEAAAAIAAEEEAAAKAAAEAVAAREAAEALAAKAAEEMAATKLAENEAATAAEQEAKAEAEAAEARNAVEAEKERLRDERKRERLEDLRKRSNSFVQPSVPATSFSNVRDVTRGQPSSLNNLGQNGDGLPLSTAQRLPSAASSLQLSVTQYVQSAIEMISPRRRQAQPEADVPSTAEPAVSTGPSADLTVQSL